MNPQTPYALLCSLEMLEDPLELQPRRTANPPAPPQEEDSPRSVQLHVGINLVAALWNPPNGDAANADLRKREKTFVQPWKWPGEILGFHAFLSPPDGDPRPISTSSPSSSQEDQTHDLGDWRKSFEKRLEKRMEKRGDLVWCPGRTDPHWPTLLGELSQLPWPLPQALRLTHRVVLELTPEEWEECTRTVDPSRLLVAPLLPANLLSTDKLSPEPFTRQAGMPTLAYRWDGGTDAADAPLAFCFCNALDPKQASPADFVYREGAANGDGDGWVLRPFDEDWRTRFEHRILSSLRLGPELLSWIRDRKRETTFSQADALMGAHLRAWGWTGSLGSVKKTDWESRLQELAAACEKAYDEQRLTPPNEMVQDLRSRLLGQLRSDRDTRQNLAAGYRAFLEAHLTPPPDGDWRPPAWLNDWIDDFAARKAGWLYPLAESGAGEPTKAPDRESQHDPMDHQTDGITLQVGPLSRDPEIGSGSEPGDAPAPDPLQDIRGVVVLASAQGDDEWQCLNWARAYAGDRPEALDLPTVLLPARLSYVGDIHQATLTYDNAPLSVEGPLESLKAWQLCAREEREPEAPPFRFTFDVTRKIPGLVFGRRYRLAAFRVGNSGRLPKQLTGAGSPWALQDKISGGMVPEEAVVMVPYLRKVPVGAARVDGPFRDPDGGNRQRVRLGAPPNVVPRMAEVAPRLSTASPKAADVSEPGATSRRDLPGEALPYLLLHRDLGSGEDTSSCRFEIRPPAVDWRTWDRWVAGDDVEDGAEDRLRTDRQKVLALYHEIRWNLDRVGGFADAQRRKAAERELVLDDPAVEAFRVVVKDLDLDQEVLEGMLDLGSDGDEGDHLLPGEVRRKPSTLLVSACAPHGHSPRAYRPSAGTDGLHLELSEGHLYRVSVYPVLVSEGRFERLRGDEPIWELDVEVAEPFFGARELPGVQADLGRFLRPSVDGGVLRVDLDLQGDGNPPPAALERLRRHVVKAQLLRQSWAWDGRPVPTHPKLAGAFAGLPGDAHRGDSSPGDSATPGWETITMGHREDAGHGLYAMRRRTPGESGDGRQTLLPRWTWEEDLGSGPEAPDPRASHHRFSVRVHSRYAGLYRRGVGSLEATRSAEDRGLAWCSAFVPCRWTGEVPTPRVRAVLPLTRNRHPEDAKRDGSRPFLVILEEGWHQVGGLAERLEVEPVKWVRHSPQDSSGSPGGNGDSASPQRVVAGPDPIVSADPDTAVPVLEVLGAIGHSREIDTPLPRISATSFVVYARHPEGKPLDWWFLQVRFRRQVYVEEKWEPSKATRPFWIQLLPAFELDRFGRRPEKVEWDGSSAAVVAESGDAPRKAVDDSGHMVPYLLLSRRIVDVLGRPGEVVLGLLHPKRSAASPGDLQFEPEEDLSHGSLDLPDLQVRLLEVQQHGESKPYCTAKALWQALFPPPDRDDPRWDRPDVQARIVGISDPFPVGPREPRASAVTQDSVPSAATSPMEGP